MKTAIITGITGQDGAYLPSCYCRTAMRFMEPTVAPAPSTSGGSKSLGLEA